MALELYRKKDEPNLGQVGDIKTSVLTEAQFQSIHGSTWTLMDGKSVAGSRYEQITGESAVPDARGQFLRCKNNGRSDGEEDPEGERNLGASQNDKTRAPRDAAFGADSGGSHSHTFGGSNGAGGGAGIEGVGWGLGRNNRSYTWPTDGAQGAHSHSVSGGDAETRPRNIAVNYFVKID